VWGIRIVRPNAERIIQAEEGKEEIEKPYPGGDVLIM